MIARTGLSFAGISEDSITLGGRTIAYRIRRSARARWIRLETKPESGLTVVIPRGCSIGCVPEVLKKKQTWIMRALERCDRAQRRPRRVKVRAGDAVPYLGRKLTVLTESSRSEANCVRLERDRLTASLACPGEDLSATLERWYRAQAAELISEKVQEWSARLGVKHNRMIIRGQRTRWGSCSRRGNLSFNWKLLMAPEAVIDYVVVHELAHLKEMNHSRKFWRLVARHCPAWHELRQWLKTHETDIAAGLLAGPGS